MSSTRRRRGTPSPGRWRLPLPRGVRSLTRFASPTRRGRPPARSVGRRRRLRCGAKSSARLGGRGGGRGRARGGGGGGGGGGEGGAGGGGGPRAGGGLGGGGLPRVGGWGRERGGERPPCHE